MGRRFPPKQTALTVQSSLTTLQLDVRIAYRCHFGTLLPMWGMFGHSGRCGSVPATPRACRRCGRRRLAAGRKRKARCRCGAASVGLALLLTLCLCVCGATPAVGLIFFVTTAIGAAVTMLAFRRAAFALSGQLCLT